MKYFRGKGKNALKYNLQFFAEGGDGDGDGSGDGGAGEGDIDSNKESFTKEEVLNLIKAEREKNKAETDRRVNQAIEKITQKHKRQLEIQKTLSVLDDDARTAAAKDLRIQELEEALEKSNIANTKAEISKILSKRGMSVDLVDFVVTSADENECLEKINTLEEIYKEMVKNGVQERLKGYGGQVKGGADSDYTGITKEDFAKMSLSEQNEFYLKNKDLYMELIKK